VAQNLGNHRGIVNGGEDGQGAATLGTGGDIDGECVSNWAQLIRARGEAEGGSSS
jgi:hypothetical protein